MPDIAYANRHAKSLHRVRASTIAKPPPDAIAWFARDQRSPQYHSEVWLPIVKKA